jgi:hypothetical protein
MSKLLRLVIQDTELGSCKLIDALQSAEATRMMLGGVFRKVIVSTMAEIRGLLPLVREGLIDEVRSDGFAATGSLQIFNMLESPYLIVGIDVV